MFQIEVFRVVTPHSVAIGYQRFREIAASIFMLKSLQSPLKRWYPPTKTLHGVTHNPEALFLNLHHCGNLISHKLKLLKNGG